MEIIRIHWLWKSKGMQTGMIRKTRRKRHPVCLVVSVLHNILFGSTMTMYGKQCLLCFMFQNLNLGELSIYLYAYVSLKIWRLDDLEGPNSQEFCLANPSSLNRLFTVFYSILLDFRVCHFTNDHTIPPGFAIDQPMIRFSLVVAMIRHGIRFASETPHQNVHIFGSLSWAWKERHLLIGNSGGRLCPAMVSRDSTLRFLARVQRQRDRKFMLLKRSKFGWQRSSLSVFMREHTRFPPGSPGMGHWQWVASKENNFSSK